jgi:copper chaperone NosL
MSANVINQETPSSTSIPQPVLLDKILGRIPAILMVAAAILLLISMSYPYWGMVLLAPQYPGGLSMHVYVNYVTGDDDPQLDEVAEIDGLNHYIGMKSLNEAAQFERSIAVPSIIVMAILLVVAAFWHNRWTWILTVPMMLFPAIFLADLAFWMNQFGQNLDPYAPLSSAIKPFTPPVLGEGVIGQFSSLASVEIGWYMAVIAGTWVLVGLSIRFGAYIQKRSQGG